MRPATRRRREDISARVLFALARRLFIAILVAAAGLLALDVGYHWRVRDASGINIWGYRGPLLSRKASNETRLVMLGGSTAYGYGLRPDQSVPAYLERGLNQRSGQTGRRFSVANLGGPGQGAYAFVFDLEDFEFLNYDVVVLYEGYNDLGRDEIAHRDVPNLLVWHRESPVFRLTGYYPILPVVLREKSIMLLNGDDGSQTERDGKVVFRPGLASRATAGTLNAAAAVSESLGRQIGRLSDTPPAPSVDEECVPRWKQYCGAIRDAVSWALARNKRVLFASQPYASDSHVEQQANAVAMLKARFGDEPRLRWLDLGRAIDLRDLTIAWDGVHLIPEGNESIAARMVEPVLDLIR